jgi:hypothetical protein
MKDDFPAMNDFLRQRLVGTWFIGGMAEGGEGLLVITAAGRVVQFPGVVKRPRMNETMRLWLGAGVADQVWFRPSPEAAGWWRRVEFSGPDWMMIAVETETAGEQRFPCRPASRVFLPDWFDEELAKNLGRMAALESGGPGL